MGFSVQVHVRRLCAFASTLLLVAASSIEVRASDAAVESPEARAWVADALRAEVAGQSARRDALLKQAMSKSPDYGPANWHLGRVRSGESWLPVAKVEAAWAKDQRLTEYHERRLTSRPDVDGQWKLANWCRDHRLPDRERLHLMKVIQMQPNHSGAMRRLGMRQYRGRWLPEEQVEQVKQADAAAQKAKDHWTPILTRWRKQIEQSKSHERADALHRLHQVTDPAAYRVIEVEFSEQGKDLGLEVIGLLGRDSRQEATDSLLRHAVFCQFAEVRAAACEQLKKRSTYAYVPVLLGHMAPAVEVTVEHPLGERTHERRTVRVKGPEHDLVWVHSITRYNGDVRRGQLALAPPSRTIRERNTPKTRLNERIQTVLRQTTGEDFQQPDQWWDWWKKYNEYETEKPVYAYQTHRYEQMPTRRSGCCLAWGTQIWTQRGPAPVEKIRVGDKVLSQDPESGELAYKLVLETTIRRLGEMREIHLGDETVTVTVGHPLWEVGKGWQMAKELRIGGRLHCLTGSRRITRIEELPQDVGYNLVVEDFNTYFVGASRILLHDNLLRKPTAAIVPGLPGREAAVASRDR